MYVIARSAFGELYLWEGNTLDKKSFSNIIFFSMDADRKNLNLKEENIAMNQFIVFLHEHLDEKDGSEKPLFERCLKKFGKVEAGEMYAYWRY